MKIMNVLMPNFKKRGGLVTVVMQDVNTKEILMVASTDKAGFEETLESGEAVFYSTSRKQRWKKGEKSGNIHIVHSIRIDCDLDALIYEVDQREMVACHTGNRTCFYRSVIEPVLFINKKEKIKNLPIHKNIKTKKEKK